MNENHCYGCVGSVWFCDRDCCADGLDVSKTARLDRGVARCSGDAGRAGFTGSFAAVGAAAAVLSDDCGGGTAPLSPGWNSVQSGDQWAEPRGIDRKTVAAAPRRRGTAAD